MRDFNERHVPTGRMSSHEDLAGAAKSGEAMASADVCDRPECQRRAREWVQAVATRPAVYVPRRRS